MNVLPKEANPYIGVGLLVIAGPVLYGMLNDAASGLSVNPMGFVAAGVFLMLGIVLVVEPFVPGDVVILLLLLIGTAFWSLMAYVLLSKVSPQLATEPLVLLGAGAVGTIGQCIYYKLQSVADEPDETQQMRNRIIVRADKIKPAAKASRGATALNPRPAQDDTQPPG